MIYLNKECSYLSKFDNKKGVISNRFTGKYIHIPIECFEALVYSSEKNIALNEMTTAFEDEEDQQYYLKLLDILNKLGVISNKQENKININYIEKIEISLTNRCNLHCEYCCVESEISNKFNEMNLKEIKNMIDIIVKYLNPKTINLSGGEIFVRDDVYEIIAYARNKFVGHLSISTNGTLIKDDKIDFLVTNIDSINISLDGYNEETVSQERGKGTFTKVVNLVNNLKDRDFHKIGLSFVLSKKTEKYLKNFEQLTKDLDVNEIIRDFIAFGRGKEKNIYINNSKDVKFFDENLDHYSHYEHSMVCNAGIKSIFVNYDGNIFMCPLLQDEKFKIGDINEIDSLFLNKISNKEFKAYENLEKLKMKEIEHCNDCGYKLFCCKCPATLNLIYDNKELLEHNCEKFKKQLSIY